MFGTLLAKDLRRVRRNPLPWLIQLIVPIAVTGIVGLIFSPRSNPGGIGQIHLAFVDEDDTWLTGALRQTMGPEGRGISMKVDSVSRDEALRLVGANKLVAAVIVPKGFTDDYLKLKPVAIDVVKNPANVLHPTIVEEYLVTLATGLNALSRVAGPEFDRWRRTIEEDEDFDVLAALLLLAETGTRLNAARDYLRPPLVGIATESAPPKTAVGAPAPAPDSGAGRTFRFVLLGMSAMFMLFIADNAIRDLYRELSGRTLARYRTLRTDLLGFVTGKAVFAFAMVLIGAVILLGGGALAFQFSWRRLPELCVLVVSYAVFASGLVALIAAVAGTETRAAMFNSIIVMGLSIMGGCMFPLDGWEFWRVNIAPWMPTHWFAGTAREMHFDNGANVVWVDDAAKLVVCGGICLVVAAWRFQRRLEQGVRA